MQWSQEIKAYLPDSKPAPLSLPDLKNNNMQAVPAISALLPNSSSGIVRSILGADFQKDPIRVDGYSYPVFQSLGILFTILAAKSYWGLQSIQKQVGNLSKRFWPKQNPPRFPSQDAERPSGFSSFLPFSHGSSSFIAPISRSVNPDLPSLIPQQEELPADLIEVLENTQRNIMPVEDRIPLGRSTDTQDQERSSSQGRRSSLSDYFDGLDREFAPLMNRRFPEEEFKRMQRENDELERRAEEEDYKRALEAYQSSVRSNSQSAQDLNLLEKRSDGLRTPSCLSSDESDSDDDENWAPIDEVMQAIQANRLDPQPFLRHCRRRGDLINVDDIGSVPFDHLRLLNYPEERISAELQELEELEERAEEEDFQRALSEMRQARQRTDRRISRIVTQFSLGSHEPLILSSKL